MPFEWWNQIKKTWITISIYLIHHRQNKGGNPLLDFRRRLSHPSVVATQYRKRFMRFISDCSPCKNRKNLTLRANKLLKPGKITKKNLGFVQRRESWKVLRMLRTTKLRIQDQSLFVWSNLFVSAVYFGDGSKVVKQRIQLFFQPKKFCVKKNLSGSLTYRWSVISKSNST